MQKNQLVKGEPPSDMSPKNQINDFLNQLDEMANKIGENIEELCRKQEEKFINDYKEQMYQAQKTLSVYAQNNTEEEIKKKMKEKQQELKNKREATMSETVRISNQLKEMKSKLHEVTMNAENVDDEIKFIDEQLVVAEDKNKRLKDDVEQLKFEILRIDPNYKFWDEEASLNQILPGLPNDKPNLNMSLLNDKPNVNTSLNNNMNNNNNNNINGNNNNVSQQIPNNNNNSSFLSKVNDMGSPSLQKVKNNNSNIKPTMSRMTQSVPKLKIALKEPINGGIPTITGGPGPRNDNDNLKEIQKLKKEIEMQKQINEKLTELSESEAFYPGRYETIFIECIKKVSKNRDNIKQSKSVGKLPNLKGVENSVPQEEAQSFKQMSLQDFMESNFTDLEKKLIMEEFLKNPIIKEMLYQKLVKLSNKQPNSNSLNAEQ